MGRLTGFISGATLTLFAAYFSLSSHQRSRISQSASLRQQSLILHSLVEPDLVPVDDPPRFRVKRVSWSETWKDRWNKEVESLVRGSQDVDWDFVRAGLEGRVRGWLERDKDK